TRHPHRDGEVPSAPCHQRHAGCPRSGRSPGTGFPGASRMTGHRDIDQLIHSFMQEGPAELSSRLAASIRDEVHGTHQRAPTRPWRTDSMQRPFLMFAVLGAIVIALGAAVLAGTGARPGTISPSAAPSSAPSIAP